MVSMPESSALTLRLPADDDVDAVASDTAEGNTREEKLLTMTAESQSLTIFFLWAGVIFDQ